MVKENPARSHGSAPSSAGRAATSSNGPVPAYQQLATRLRDEILSGQRSPGDQLPTESDLSSAFEVSRGTAREALRSLESLGLVVVKRGVAGGAFVTVPSPDRVRDSLQTGLALMSRTAELSVDALIEIREILEVPGAELAALRHTDEDLERIRANLFDTNTMGPDQVYTCSQRFHTSIQQAAHNPMLDLLTEPIAYVIRDRIGRDRDDEFWQEIDRAHREILGYLEVRDQSGTREAMRAHLRGVRPAYQRIVGARTKTPDPALDT